MLQIRKKILYCWKKVLQFTIDVIINRLRNGFMKAFKDLINFLQNSVLTGDL